MPILHWLAGRLKVNKKEQSKIKKKHILKIEQGKMASYAQPGAKRQKPRERVDNVDYFQGIEKVEFNSSASHTDTTMYRYYNSTERMHSRSMEEWLKISVSFTEFRYNGHGNHSRPNPVRSWDDGTDSLENHKRSLKALFDFMAKLNVKYWTAFDTDLVPYSDSWEESKAQWDEMTEFIVELTQKYHVKLLWLAPDLHSRLRYTAGALTNPDASTFIQAAAQIKKCLEVSQRLNAENFLLWPYREGYTALYQTDVQREIKLFAKMLKMTAEYKERLNYRCQLLIMPYYSCNREYYNCNLYNEDMLNTYMWDVTSCLYLLKNYNLERYYKVCCESGHHMFMANAYNMLGGICVSNENDMNRYNRKRFTLMMKCIVDQGTPLLAGINLKLTPRRDSDLRDMVSLYARYIDSTARAFRIACNIIADQVFSKHVQQRYSTYHSGIGSRLVSADVTLEECEENHKKNQSGNEVMCSKSEHLDMVFQRYLDACDHI